jgi:Flp pilus assembly CpaF family ATPase
VSLESDLRATVLDELATLVSAHTAEGRPAPTEADKRMKARAVLRREIDAHIAATQQAGDRVLSTHDERELTERVVASVFSLLPGAEAFLGRDDVTNVMVIGNEPVQLRLVDGTRTLAPPMVERDEDLVEVLQTAARRAGHTEREFSETRPVLEMQLRDGSRLAGAAWICPRPYLSIRRHPLITAGHDDLVARGMYDRGVESLLRAMVRARWNGMICGGTDAGKTTLLRAMLADVDPTEWPVTLESDPELRMEEVLPGANFRAFYERGANAEGQGELSLAELSKRMKRHTPSRIIVGEVRGAEVITMLEVMTAGEEGSWCTMHAQSSAAVFPRLHVYSAHAEGTWSREVVYDMAALALDVVIFLRSTPEGRKVISEIRHIESYDHLTGQVISSEWFVPGPDGSAVPNPDAPIPVEDLDVLVAHGYQPHLHDRSRNGAGAL